MDIENLFKRLDEYLNSILSIYTINSLYKQRFLESIKLIKCHIDILDQEKQVEKDRKSVV